MLYSQVTASVASGTGCGMIFVAPKTGTIDAVYVGITATSGSPTITVGLEGATSTRSPDGTYKNSGNAKVDLVNPSTGGAWRTLGATASVTAGDNLATTVRYSSGTSATIANTISSETCDHPFGVTLSGGTWSQGSGIPLVAARYTDGTVVGAAGTSATVNSWGNGTTPLLRGNLWVPPMDCKVYGAVVTMRLNVAGGSAKVSVYDGTTLLVSQTLTQAVTSGTNNPGTHYVYFPEQSLTAGGSYRFVLEPTTAATIGGFGQFDFVDSTGRDGYKASLLTGTTANTAGGAWTDTSNRMYSILPLVSEVSSGGSSGGIVIGG
jgi:hypothetical protein